MIKYLLSLLLTSLALCVNAQTYLNPGVDTSGIEVQTALKFFNHYLASFKGKELPDLSKFWKADELGERTIPDQQIYAINDSPLYSQGYKATILYIKPTDKYIHFKTQFSAVNDSVGNIMTIAVTNHYIVLNGKNGSHFINPFTINLASWRSKKLRNVTFFYPTKHQFNARKADSLIQQIVKLEKDWNLKPIEIRYYLANTWDELQKLRGFDFALSMGNREKPSGISDDKDNQVFCAGLGENYFHEVVHVYLNRLYPKSPIREGLAVFYGGSMGHSIDWQLKRVNAYLEKHPEADLNNLEGFWYADLYTNPGSAIRGLICSIVYKKDGIMGLKRLMSYTSMKDIFKLELKVEDGQWNSYLRKTINEHSEF